MYRSHPEEQEKTFEKDNHVYCINCEYMCVPYDRAGSDSWKCRIPGNVKRNFQSGKIVYDEEYCSHKNKYGLCLDYKEKQTALRKRDITVWKRVIRFFWKKVAKFGELW